MFTAHCSMRESNGMESEVADEQDVVVADWSTCLVAFASSVARCAWS